MPSRSKYRKTTDLYVLGTEVVLRDGSVIWVQALNPFERDEAMRTAAAARSRFQLAMKEIGSDELVTFRADAGQIPRERKATQLAEMKASEALTRIISEIEADDEWAEVKEVLDRADELNEGSDEEKQLVEKKTREYMEEINKRLKDERDFLEKRYLESPDEELDSELEELWVEAESNRRATDEYELVEVLLGARACDAVERDDGTWDHSACESHILTAFEDRREVKSLPEPFYQEIRDGFEAINMHPLDPKGLASPESSSESSQPPSEEEASEPSTPEATSSDAPGTST